MTETINYLRRCADNRVLEASLTPEMCREIVQMCDDMQIDRDTAIAEWQASERRAIEFGDIVARHVAVMRAAVLDGDAGMQWIINTLAGPGHLPDGLGEHADAQDMFDAEVEEIEAHRAKHPIPEPVVGPLRRKAAELQRERDAALAELERAREVLDDCAVTLEGYAKLHAERGPEHAHKVARNAALAARCRAAMAAKGE